MNIDPQTGIWLDGDRHRIYDQSLADCLTKVCLEKKFSRIVDLGCGHGLYVKHLRNGGVNCVGYDGNPHTPEITDNDCGVLDLSKPIEIGTLPCVISLEVGEHIPPDYQEIYINNLLRTATDYLILSWAIPGQGGVGHYNERPQNEIIERFERNGIWKLDNATAQVLRQSSSLPWFKNTILCFERTRELKGRILDFGCGSGEASILLARYGLDVVGCDASAEAIETANRLRSAESDEVQKHVSFVHGSERVLPFPDQSFDSILCNDVLEQIGHLTPVLKEMARVLRPGGSFVVQVPSGIAHYDVSHTQYFDVNQLKSVLQDFFDNVDVHERSNGSRIEAVCSNRQATRHPRIVCQIRIKNEERWLKDVLDSIARVVDGIVIVDDGSTDNTPLICKFHPAVVDYHYQNEPITDQRRDKQKALQMAIAQKPDWILGLDGDEMLESSAAPRIFEAIRTCPSDVGVLKIESLFMWNDMHHYRADGIYQRICQERLFRLTGQDETSLQYQPTNFAGNGHCTRLPGGIKGREIEVDVKILHLGYIYPDVRHRHHEYYRKRDPKEFATGFYNHLLDQPGQILKEWQERPFPRKSTVNGSQKLTKVTKQEHKPEYYYANARRNLVDLVPANSYRVLDVGCGQGLTGGLLRHERHIEVIGLEIHPDVAETAREHLSDVIVGDLENIELPFAEGYFDCIIMGDVLEHLTNPWQALKKLVRHLNPSGTIVASVPNVRNLGVMKKVMEGSWAYEEWGILDKTHLRFFALKDMFAMFEQAGIEAKVVEVVRDPLFEKDIKTLPTTPTDIEIGHLLLRAISPKDLDELTAQQFIFTGTLRTAANQVPSTVTRKKIPVASVIIPVFNNLDYTRKCITSLFTVKETVDFEVIVVDNGSSDGTADYLRQLPPPVHALTMPENLGFAKGCNAGARVAQGKYLVFLNNDTMVLPNWLKSMVDCLESDATIGLVGNLQIFPDTERVQQAGIVCGPDAMVYSIYNNQLSANHPAVQKPRDFQFIAGSCMALRQSEFLSLGGFDESYLNSCEDIDLCLRVRETGKRVHYCPASRIYHFESKTVQGHDKSGANYQRLLERWRDKMTQDDFNYYAADGFNYDRFANTVLPMSVPSTPPAGEQMVNYEPKPSSTSLRVALLTTYNQTCGLAMYAESMVVALREQGIQPLILAEKTPATRGLDRPGVIRCWTREKDGGAEIVNLLKQHKIDLLHINHGGIFAADGWLEQVLIEVRSLGVNVVTTFHSTEYIGRSLSSLANYSDRCLVHHSQNVLELVATGAPFDRLNVVPLGIPKLEIRDLFESKIEAGWNPREKVVTTFGFVEPHKGVLELIEAIQLVQAELPVRLRILGGPHPSNAESKDYLETCKSKVRDLGLGNTVTFTDGFIDDAQLSRYLHASDAIVMNYQSHRYEGSAATALALSSGRPVISSSAPSLEYPLAVTLKLTKEFNLPNAIHLVLSNPYIAAALLQNVKDYEKIANWDVVAGQISSIYRSVASDDQRPSYDLLKHYYGHPDAIYNEPLQRERVRWLKSKAKGRILEIGPATGYVAEYIGAAAAVDINQGRLAVCSALRPGIDFRYGNVVAGLPFADHEFDTVMAPEILEHVDFECAVQALLECARVGKRVVLTLPNADKPNYNPDLVHNPEHRWLVTRQFVDRLLREAECHNYELDTSPDLDFYLLDICTDGTQTGARIQQQAALLPTVEYDPGEPLHIGIDAGAFEDATSVHRGASRHAANLFREMKALRPAWSFTMLGVQDQASMPELIHFCKQNQIEYSSWSGLADVKPDVLYFTHPASPYATRILESIGTTDMLVACTFQHLAPWVLADSYLTKNPAFASHYISHLRCFKEHCDLFLAVSENTVQDLQAHLQLPLARLRTIHAGVDEQFRNPPSAIVMDKVLRRFDVFPSEFLLAVGVPEFRKNPVGMFLALAKARTELQHPLKLVMVGDIPPTLIDVMEKLSRDCGLPEDAVVLAGYLSDQELNALYHSALALLYPSHYEGFGLPIVEAMAAGLPVIAGKNTGQIESAGEAAVLVNSHSLEQISRSIVEMASNPEYRSRMSMLGKTHSQHFTWRKTAEKTAIYLAEAVSRFKPKHPSQVNQMVSAKLAVN